MRRLVLDMYGKREVYRGSARKFERRYLVWFGSRQNGSFTGNRRTYRTLLVARIRARAYEAAGYDTKITDRLVRLGDTRVLTVDGVWIPQVKL